MRVTNRHNWYRTKVQFGFVLFLTAIGFAGGLDSKDPMDPIPSPIGFITTMALLGWLTLNLIKTNKGVSRIKEKQQ